MPNWQIFDKPLAYEPTISAMSAHVQAMQKDEADEAVWVLSHEAIYTGGTSAEASDIIGMTDIPFVETGRGGQ